MKEQSTMKAFKDEIKTVNKEIKKGIKTHGKNSVIKLKLYKCALEEHLIKLKSGVIG